MIKVGALSYALLIKALEPGELTLRELADETGLHYLTIAHYTKALYKVKAIHIAGWAQDSRGRQQVKLYKLGTGRDVKRKPVSATVRQQHCRDKRKALELLHRMAGP